ncbi:LPP20 family lipoprotein [Glaciecola sp. XM2]|uniref:LPP20 family lipoprotein n=1 Tax=Glaciecola sp. XM2 TaxID=1914931 RepID=UPI001BDF6A72|nr:LPP20 family lipoprotein [Glaciecola sp. XM2]MBT1450787.1 LPP20 family lipoprotein [Glaciecola sp. XM2]
MLANERKTSQRLKKFSRTCLCVVGLSLGLSACQSPFTKHVEWETIEPENYPILNAVGYAPIDAQLGLDLSSKRLQAMKASKLDAYRELAEQVYGQKVDGEQSLANLVLTNNQLQTSVEGVIRGARVVKTYPVGDDTYATELQLDMAIVYDLYLATAKPQKIRKVSYY